MDNLELFLH